MKTLRQQPCRPSAHFAQRVWPLWIIVAAFALGCIEREALPVQEKSLVERFDSDQLNVSTRNFVGHTLELGGVTECSQGRFQEQVTEAYLKTTRTGTEKPLPVSKMSVRITYNSGIFRNADTTAREKNASYAQVGEQVSARLNGGDICSCVRINGFATIIGRNVMVATRACPESKQPRKKLEVRARPSEKRPQEPETAL